VSWNLVYRLSVIALLILILAQLTGLFDLRGLPSELRTTVKSLRNAGGEQEGPTPWQPSTPSSGQRTGGIAAIYEEDNRRREEAARQSRGAASATFLAPLR
jgi:hypothetical protein